STDVSAPYRAAAAAGPRIPSTGRSVARRPAATGGISEDPRQALARPEGERNGLDQPRDFHEEGAQRRGCRHISVRDDAKIEAFPPNGSTGFQPASSSEVEGDFTDPKIPAGFAPFGIKNIEGALFVTYAQQDAAKHDDVPGQGHGFVGIFDTDGHLIQRFA